MRDTEYMKNWRKVRVNEHQVTTNILENEYKEFIKKLNFDPKFVKVDSDYDSNGLVVTKEIFLKVDEDWEPIGVVNFKTNGEIVRDGQSWFNIEGLEPLIEKYSKMIKEESAAGMGGAEGFSSLPSLDNSYGYWSAKKKSGKTKVSSKEFYKQ